MKQPTDKQMERLLIAVTELLASANDMARAAKRVSERSKNAAGVLEEIVKHMEGK